MKKIEFAVFGASIEKSELFKKNDEPVQKFIYLISKKRIEPKLQNEKCNIQIEILRLKAKYESQ